MLSRLLNVFRLRGLEREFDDELRFHLEARVRRNRQLGMTPGEAEADARARLGDMDRVKAGMRAARTVPFTIATHQRYQRPALMALVLILSVGTLSLLRFGSSKWPPDVVELDDDMVAPVAVSKPRPDYTPGAMRAKVQGVIRLRCVVSLDGECTDVTVVRSLDPQFGLDTAAVRALREWRFQPGRRDGRPVATRIELEFAFSLR